MTADTPRHDIFEDPRDQQLMLEWKTAYTETFQRSETGSTQTGIEVQHRSVPPSLDLTIEKRDRFLPFLSKKAMGCLPCQLVSAQLKPDYFRDISETYVSAINYALTQSLIAEGMNYVDHIERDWIERKTWHSFETINRPTYYLIFMLCERVKVLCKTAATATLIAEYASLIEFVTRATRIAQDYLTSSDSVHPFHRYLQQVRKHLSDMQHRIVFYLERMAMATALEKLGNLLDAYRTELTIYLMYSISNAPLNEGLNLAQLTHDSRSLPVAFRKTRIFQQLRQVINHASGEKPPCLKPIDWTEEGVSELLVKYARKNHTQRQQIQNTLSAYHQLVQSLMVFSQLGNNLRAITEATQFHGEYEVVHDTTLHATLTTHLTLVTELTNGSQQTMTRINQQNLRILHEHENFKRGATGNIQRAEEQTRSLVQIAQPIHVHQHHINQRIEKIRNLNPKVLVAQRNKLFVQTESLLKQAQCGIIPAQHVSDLLASLYQNCPDKQYPLAKNSHDCQSIQEKEFWMKKHRLSKSNEFHEKFSGIYAEIMKQADAEMRCQEVDQLLEQCYQEVEKIFPAVLDQVQEIILQTEQLERGLQQLSAITLPLNPSHLTGAKSIFAELSQRVNDTKYHQLSFTAFAFLDEMTAEYIHFRDLLLKQLQSLIEPQTHRLFAQPRIIKAHQLTTPVLVDLTVAMQANISRIDQLKQRIPTEKFSLSPLMTHYEERMNQWKKKVSLVSTADPVNALTKSANPDACVLLPAAKTNTADSTILTPGQPDPFRIIKTPPETTNSPTALRTSVEIPPDLQSDNRRDPITKAPVEETDQPPVAFSSPQSANSETLKMATSPAEKAQASLLARRPPFDCHTDQITVTTVDTTPSQATPFSEPLVQPETAPKIATDPAKNPQTPLLTKITPEWVFQRGRQVEIKALAEELFNANLNSQQMKEKLMELMNLLDALYEFPYGGRQRIKRRGETPKKVPAHIARVFRCYEEKIEDAVTLADVIALRNEVFYGIHQAANHPPTCCFFFSTRDEPTTQAVYDILAESIPRAEDQNELKTIGQALYNIGQVRGDDPAKIAMLKAGLAAFVQLLIDAPYRLKYWGGHRIHPDGQRSRKVPHHVKRVYKRYREKIGGEQTVGTLISLRDELFNEIKATAEKTPTYACGLFSPRDEQTTQKIYRQVARCTPGAG